MKTLHRGDITLLTVIMISAIMLIILGSLSQKSSRESVISRENLYSQQAIQAANTGLDAWQYQFVQGPVNPSNNLTKDWPTLASSSTGTQEWIELLDTGSRIIDYQVKFIAATSTPPAPAKIISTGRVTIGSLVIERTLEQEFN